MPDDQTVASLNERPPRTRRVLLGPTFADNPYTGRLIGALIGHGMEVRPFQNPKSFEEDTAWLESDDVLHLQWAHVFTVGRRGMVSVRGTRRLLAGLARLRARGVRIVWTIHNLVHHEAGTGALGTWVQMRAMQKIASACDALVVHGQTGAEQVRRAYRVPTKPIAVVDHPSFIGCYPAGISQEDARSRLGLPQEATVLAHVGQLRRYKGVVHLVEAFAGLGLEGTCLIVAGKASDPKTLSVLRAAADGHGIFLFEGFVPDGDLQLYFSAADAVVLPYDRVFTSGSAALAGTFGKSVIAPEVGCLPDQVGVTGTLYDPRSPDGLVRALQVAVHDRHRLSMLGEMAHSIAVDRTWDKLARGVMSVY